MSRHTDNFRAEYDATENSVAISTVNGDVVLRVYGRGPALLTNVGRAISSLREELSELDELITEEVEDYEDR